MYEFLKTNNESIQDAVAVEGINWHFIPPRSPTFGGLWEAGIKNVKFHLKRVLSSTPLNYEEFNTILTQIEAVLNSRPLTPFNDDPNDLEILTPGHFLIGRSFVAIPDPNATDRSISRLTRYQLVSRLTTQFWNKWYKEYLHTLQQRTKWKSGTYPVHVGDMVLLKKNHLPPGQWRLGRILLVHPGPDGVVRVVTVKCASGEVKRAINKVCLLPLCSDKTNRTLDLRAICT